MTDTPKTPDHSIPIYGRPLKTDGTLYYDRLGGLHGPMTCCSNGWYRDQHNERYYIFGNLYSGDTHDLDLISEYTPPAKVVEFRGYYSKGEPRVSIFSMSTLADAREEWSHADCIVELHEVARHPVNKGDV